MNEYKLKIKYRVWDVDATPPMQIKEGVFTCTVENRLIQFPPEVLRIIHKRSGSLGATSMEWIGPRPNVYACGALNEEQAALFSKQANDLGDIGMSLLDQPEPMPVPGMEALFAPAEGPVKVIGAVVDGKEQFENEIPPA